MADPSFEEFRGHLKAGENDAWRDLNDRFSLHLRNVAEAKLDARLRSRTSPDTIVRSAMGSFDRLQKAGDVELRSWGELCEPLVAIVLHKCLNANRYHHQQCRDVEKEKRIDDNWQGDNSGEFFLPDNRFPRPETETEMNELIDRLLNGLSAQEQVVLSLLRQGESPVDIARTADLALRAVYRIRKRIERKIQALRQEPPK